MAAYEESYSRTAVGTVEIKNLPASTVMSATAPGDAFNDRGTTFMKLFRYISANQVAMTVPVEADAKSNRMRFFVGGKDRQR